MITTGKTINDLLKASTALTALVGSKIYPLVAPENTPSPFVLYERSFVNQKTKDGQAGSDSTITITVISDNYTETISISTAIHEALKAEANLLSGNEAYDAGAYIQTLIFQFWSA